MSPRRLERLETHHDLAQFQSGNDTLDTWLRQHAFAAQKMDSARTFVLVDDGRIVGYFSLTMGCVDRPQWSHFMIHRAQQERIRSESSNGFDTMSRPGVSGGFSLWEG